MKKDYLNPEMDIVMFAAEDIIATSYGIDVDDGDDKIDLPFIPAE